MTFISQMSFAAGLHTPVNWLTRTTIALTNFVTPIQVPASDFAYLFTEEPQSRVSAAEAVRRVQNMLQENGVQVSVKVFDPSSSNTGEANLILI